MRALLIAFAAVDLLSSAAAAPADDQPKAGTYELIDVSPFGGTRICLIKLTPAAGGWTGEVIATHPNSPKYETVAAVCDGGVLRLTLRPAAGKATVFEGRVPAAGIDVVLGALDGGYLSMGKLALSEKTELTASERIRQPTPAAMRTAMNLDNNAARLRFQASRAKDAGEKAKLTDEAKAAQQKYDTEGPALYREVIEKDPEALIAGTAAEALIRRAARDKADPAEVGRWAALAVKLAAPYGPRYEARTVLRLTELLGNQTGYEPLALEYADRAEKALSATDPAAAQVKVLEVVLEARKKAGRSTADTEARLVKLGDELDREYLARPLPFAVAPFGGRKTPGDRGVVAELFTGTECPPCVGADAAFDALAKTYKPAEVILLEHHLHVPGPDPLTNPATKARWAYYQDRFPKDVRGTPTMVVDGTPQAFAGGPLDKAGGVYEKYREAIDKRLEAAAAAALTLDATRAGDAVAVRVGVAKLADPGDDKRLRLFLVEDTVKYAGGNGVRFHHMVVREAVGDPDGYPLTSAGTTHAAEVRIDEVRSRLAKYLEEYAADERPFPRAARPMDLNELKVVALVQDDETGEVLQAATADVTAK